MNSQPFPRFMKYSTSAPHPSSPVSINNCKVPFRDRLTGKSCKPHGRRSVSYQICMVLYSRPNELNTSCDISMLSFANDGYSACRVNQILQGSCVHCQSADSDDAQPCIPAHGNILLLCGRSYPALPLQLASSLRKWPRHNHNAKGGKYLAYKCLPWLANMQPGKKGVMAMYLQSGSDGIFGPHAKRCSSAQEVIASSIYIYPEGLKVDLRLQLAILVQSVLVQMPPEDLQRVLPLSEHSSQAPSPQQRPAPRMTFDKLLASARLLPGMTLLTALQSKK